jgi:hypothetical protein
MKKQISAIIILSILFIYSVFYLPQGLVRDFLIIVIPVVLSFLGYTIRDFFQELNEKRAAKKIQNQVINNLTRFFPKYLPNSLKLKNLDNEVDEIKLLTQILRDNFTQNDDQFITGCILCYYCKKWNDNKNSDDFYKIKQYADLLGVKNFQITDGLNTFLELYYFVIKPDGINEINNDLLLKHFIEHYYKELYLFEIAKEISQTKNLHDTLKQLITEGKFSTYGITRESLKKIQKDVKYRLSSERMFIVLHDGVNDEVKNYLRSLPGLSGCNPSARNIDINAKYGMFIVKPPKINSSPEFVEIIKSLCDKNSEIIVRIIPIDFSKDEVFTVPANRSFTSEKMLNCYNAIEWFKTGYESEDALIWNEIAKSSVTLNELASIIPFNIFCPGLFESERMFLITHYDTIKEKLNVTTLNEWKNINPLLLATHLMSKGMPDYNQEEMSVLKIRSESEKEDRVTERFLELANQIVDGAKKVDEAINK